VMYVMARARVEVVYTEHLSSALKEAFTEM
jgi:hypothetical protein